MRARTLIGAITIATATLASAEDSLLAAGQNPWLYDDFAAPTLDLSKWFGAPSCSQFLTLECMRAVHGSSLHLAATTYGRRNTDSASIYDTSSVYFANPMTITSIDARVTIPSSNAVQCPANPTLSHTHFILTGAFFNTGSGKWTEDVNAYVVLDQFGSPTSSLIATAFLSVGQNFFGNVLLGNVAPGDTVHVTLRWDASGSQFVASLKQDGSPAVVAAIPYSQTNVLPPFFPNRLLGVRTFVPSCTATETVASMTAQVGKVLVNSPRTP